MSKKITVILIVVIGLGLFLTAYQHFFKVTGSAGEKTVSLEIEINKKDIDETYSYQTDQEFLYDLLKQEQNKLEVVFKKYNFGEMVTGLLGYQANEANQEYFHIYVNGQDATSGPREIPLQDGDKYKIELKAW